jgi:hypothetical protein
MRSEDDWKRYLREDEQSARLQLSVAVAPLAGSKEATKACIKLMAFATNDESRRQSDAHPAVVLGRRITSRSAF